MYSVVINCYIKLTRNRANKQIEFLLIYHIGMSDLWFLCDLEAINAFLSFLG